MSLQKTKLDEKVSNNSNIFLGKKLENNEKCKICHKNSNLIKCFNCLNYFCNDCLSNVFKINITGIKQEDYLCPNCSKKKKDNKNTNKCFICLKSLEGINYTCLNATKEQQMKLKKEIKELTENKEQLLQEEENAINEENNPNQKSLVKICQKCETDFEGLIGKYLLVKKEKEEIKQKNIIDELSNIIKKENGVININIFDILENKFEKIGDTFKDNIKKKPKDLFNSIVVNKIEKDNKNNINNNNFIIKNTERNIINNINNNKIDKKIPLININSNNKTSNIYLPNFLTIAHLQNNQNPNNQLFNPRISNNILNLPNLLNNINPQNNIIIKNNENPNIKETNDNNNLQNEMPNLINNNIIFNPINIDLNNKLNDGSNNLKEIKEELNYFNQNIKMFI